jgi:hypothetical protein
MAFTVTWADGSEITYGDELHFDTDGAVLKIGPATGKWTWYFSSHQWARIELDDPHTSLRPEFPAVVAAAQVPTQLGS